MRSRIAGRRLLTASGIYVSAVMGFLGQILAARWLGVEEYGVLAIILAVTNFAQLVTDLTVEEAVIKYGFRYVQEERWGKLRRLYARAFRVKLIGAVLAGVVIAALSPASGALFDHPEMLVPLLIAALLPLAQAPEGIASTALLLRSRYDIRSFFLVVGMGTRFVALVIGARMGDVTVILALIVVAQVVTSAAIGVVGLASLRRYPRVGQEPLGSDRPAIVRFMRNSAIGSTMTTFQGAVAPIVLGMVANPAQVGLYRAALAPQNALAAISSPIRLILLTEQTRDWERGDIQTVLKGVRRFTIGATLLMGVITPPLVVFMPDIVRAVYSDKYAAAGDAARFVLISAVLLTIIGWSKSLPVSIGRPGLRIWTHGIQALFLLPLTALFGLWWQATGAAAALAVSTVVFAALWGVIVVRLHREHRSTSSTTVPEAP